MGLFKRVMGIHPEKANEGEVLHTMGVAIR